MEFIEAPMTISIPLTEQSADRLRQLAEREGLSAEELLRRQVEDWLQSDDAFRQAAAHVLSKNAELYRRLA
jgi:hypothetical protein